MNLLKDLSLANMMPQEMVASRLLALSEPR